MKKLPLLLLATTLTALSAARAETVIFTDTFGGSTLNGSSTPSGTPLASSTSYDIASTKNGTTCSIGADLLRMKLSANTTAGYIELQSIFTSTPVQLVNVNDGINVTFTFTNVAGTLLAGGDKSQINVGLFNSGVALPLAGDLVNAGLGSATTFITGNCQSWQGYVGKINFNGFASSIYTRPMQTDFSVNAANNGVQDLLFSGAGTGLYRFPTGTTIGSTTNSTVTLATGGTYTRSFTVTLSATDEVTIKDELFSGSVASGLPLWSIARTTSGGTTYTNYSNQYDGLSIGIANSGTSMNPQMDLSKITITKYTQADLPALYNIQLNGLVSTYAGVGYIGSPGDVWNNPTLANMANDNFSYGHTTQTLATAVALVDSTGVASAATFSMTAADYKSAHAALGGTPIVGLTDRALKFDWTGSAPAPNWQMTIAGLPANKLVTVYAYSAAGSGGGSDWILNGGADSATIVNDGSSDANNVTLSKNKGISWEVLSGTTDGAGTVTINGKPGTGASIWWQTYVSGLQIQVGGTAPTIIGLADQTVEDGATVNLAPVVTGNPVPTYQWYENGTLMPAETDPALMLANVTTGQNGNVYSLVAENAIGVASNSMTLTVNASVFSPMTVVAVSPTNGATGICYDTPLTVTFSDAVSLGNIGAIKIFDAANPGTPVDTINAASGAAQQRTFPGDNQSFTYPTISISGNTVTITPHFNTLTSNTTYYVTIDPKTFLDAGGTNFVGLTDTNLWQFSTKSAPADPDNLVVNGDGSGDFVTVQGAVNSVPNANTTPRVINIRDGLYHEIVNISAKHNLTLRGESRTGTVVGFANNATYQAANGGTTHARMSFKVNANDIYLESLSLTNMTPQGGSQAEALMLESNARRFICNDATISSRQDTILANVNTSQGYFHDTRIEGNFDYIWGGGNLFFTNCTLYTIAGSASFNVTAARTQFGNDANSGNWMTPDGLRWSSNGFSFVACNFEAAGGVNNITLAGNNGTAGGLSSWINCKFSSAYVTPSVTLSNTYNLWQYENTDSGINPVSFATLVTLTNGDPRLLAAQDATTWLNGWAPQLSLPPVPPVVTNPEYLPEGSFQFSFTGGAGQPYRVWASSDLSLTPVIGTWTLLDSGNFGGAPVTFTDETATNFTQRFYLITVP
jgi:hypothetical protein